MKKGTSKTTFSKKFGITTATLAVLLTSGTVAPSAVYGVRADALKTKELDTDSFVLTAAKTEGKTEAGVYVTDIVQHYTFPEGLEVIGELPTVTETKGKVTFDWVYSDNENAGVKTEKGNVIGLKGFTVTYAQGDTDTLEEILESIKFTYVSSIDTPEVIEGEEVEVIFNYTEYTGTEVNLKQAGKAYDFGDETAPVIKITGETEKGKELLITDKVFTVVIEEAHPAVSTDLKFDITGTAKEVPEYELLTETDGKREYRIALTEQAVYNSVKVSVTDRKGNEASQTLVNEGNLVIDKTPAEITSLDQITGTVDGTSKEPVEFKMVVKPGFTGITEITTPGTKLSEEKQADGSYLVHFVITENGTHTIDITAESESGHVTTFNGPTILVDITQQELEVELETPLVNDKYAKDDVVYKVMITDPKFDGNITTTAGTLSEVVKDGDSWTTTLTLSAHGEHTPVLTAFRTDGIQFDKTLPTVVIVKEDLTVTVETTTGKEGLDNPVDKNATMTLTVEGDYIDLQTIDVLLDPGVSYTFDKVSPIDDETKVVYELTITSEGAHEPVFKVSDRAGRDFTETGPVVVIDKTAPVYTYERVGSGTIVNTDIVYKATVTDANIDRTGIKVLGGDITDLTETSPGVWTFDVVQKVDGTHMFTFDLTDKAGNNVIETFGEVITIDKTAPVVWLGIEKGTPDGGLFTTDDFIIVVEVTETNFDSTMVDIEGGTWLDAWSEKTPGSGVYVNRYQYSEEGTHKPKVHVTDKAGNQSAVETLAEFVIDKTAPVIEILKEPEAELLNKPAEYVFKLSDVNLDESLVTINDGKITSVEKTPEGDLIVTSINDKDGTYEPTITAQDKAGNKTTLKATRTTVDMTAPILTVTEVTDRPNAPYTQDKVVFELEIIESLLDSSGIVLDEGTLSAQTGSGTIADPYKYTITIDKELDKTLNVSVTDKAGNTSTADLGHVVIDRTPPKITATAKDAGDLGNENFTYTVRIEELNLDLMNLVISEGTYTAPVEVTPGVWEFEVTSEGEGSFKPTITAEDKAGNKATYTVDKEVIVDKTAPVVNFTIIEDLTLDPYTNKDFVVEVQVTEEYFDSNLVSMTGGAWQGAWTTDGNVHTNRYVYTQEGSYKAEVSATDLAGNNSGVQLIKEFTLDKTVPEVSVTKKTPGTVVSTDAEYTVRVNDKNFDEFSLVTNVGSVGAFTKVAPGIYEATLTITGEGSYRPEIQVRDLAGNESERTLADKSITIDQTGPSLRLEILEGLTHDGYTGTDYKVKVGITDDHFVAGNVDLTQGTFDGPWVEEHGEYVNTVTFSDEGTYAPTVQATDVAGNKSEVLAFEEFIIDKTKPTTTIVKRTSGTNINAELVYDITVTDPHIDLTTFEVTEGKLGEWQAGANGEYTNTVTITEEGIYQPVIRVTDKAGNTSNDKQAAEAVVIDKTAPVIETQVLEKLTGDYFTTNTHKLKVMVTEEYFRENLVSLTEGTWDASWKLENDKYINTVTYDKDGVYAPEVSVTDLAGNEATRSLGSFVVDKTLPEVILRPRGDVRNGKYLNTTSRIIDVEVRETNFDAKLVKPNKGKLSEFVDDNGVHRATLEVTGNAVHNVTIDITDLAGNKGTQKSVAEFVLDTIAPKLTVTPVTTLQNGKYISGNHVFNIVVEDVNFRADLFKHVGGTLGTWTRDGNVWRNTVTFTGEGAHTLTASATDLAGNASLPYVSPEFVIDTVKPTITFNGVTNGQVFKKTVRPGVTFDDTNIDLSKTTVVLEKPGSSSAVMLGDGTTRTMQELESTKQNDGLYTLRVNAVDLAGNEFTESVTFAVNRFGSEFASDAFDYDGKYIQELKGDIVFTETSVVPIKDAELEVYRDGILVDMSDIIKVKETRDGSYYIYTYTVDKDAFIEGSYSIVLRTYDMDGDASSTVQSELAFVLDATAPVITYNVKEGVVYNTATKRIDIYVDELYGIEDAVVRVNGKVEEVTETADGYTITLEGTDTPYTIETTVVDRAGNEATEEVTFYVSTGLWLNFRHSGWFLPGIAGVIAVPVAFILFILFKRRKEDQTDLIAADDGTTELDTSTRSGTGTAGTGTTPTDD